MRPQNANLRPAKPGEVRNPLGRPKGSRNKLSEAFLAAMHEDFEAHGVAVIAKVRKEKPDQYLKVIASILPREFHVSDAPLDDVTNDELIDLLVAIRSSQAQGSGDQGRVRNQKASRSRKTSEAGRLN